MHLSAYTAFNLALQWLLYPVEAESEAEQNQCFLIWTRIEDKSMYKVAHTTDKSICSKLWESAARATL